MEVLNIIGRLVRMMGQMMGRYIYVPSNLFIDAN